MLRRPTTRLFLSVLLLAAAGTGCARFRLPAIDPSGERIFLPAPNYTTLGTGDNLPGGSCLPRPAFQAPSKPSACPPAGVVEQPSSGFVTVPVIQAPVASQVQGDRLVLHPTRIIAPVGSEVVLLAGVCSEGYYKKRERIEWNLSRNSVGDFIEVADSGEHLNYGLFREQASKVDATYVVGRTSVKKAVLTRGNSQPNDDVAVPKGMAWVSVSSPVEGVSRISVTAPDQKQWSTRKQTANIYWVDSQWTLPGPKCGGAGRPVELTTTVRRNSDGQPRENYIVQYQVTGGKPAGFGPQLQSGAEVTTDGNGEATIQLLPATADGGTTTVKVTIIRPAGPAGDPPRLPLGSGCASVTWTAPGLALRASGTGSAKVGETLTYRLEVGNPGSFPSGEVVVTDALPAGLTMLGSNPPHQTFGSENRWELGSIAPNEVRSIDIQCRADQGGEFTYCFRASNSEGIQREQCVLSRIAAPALVLRATGPETARVGETAQFRIEIENTGASALTNVRLIDTFDVGLRHVGGQTSPMVLNLGTLAPGEISRKAVTFVADTPGRHCHVVEAVSDENQSDAQRLCLEATGAPVTTPDPVQPPPQTEPDRPGLDVSITGPGEREQGQRALYQIAIKNTGNVALTGAKVGFEYSDALVPLQASEGWQRANAPRELVWTVGNIAPGETVLRQVDCQCELANSAAQCRSIGVCDQNVTDSETVTTRINPRLVPPPAQGNNTPPPAVDDTGKLIVRVSDAVDPVRVGDTARFFIQITNDRKVDDGNITMEITIPDGLTFKQMSGPAAPVLKQQGRIVEITPLKTILPGETLPEFTLETNVVRAGKYPLKVTIRSTRVPGGVADIEEITAQ